MDDPAEQGDPDHDRGDRPTLPACEQVAGQHRDAAQQADDRQVLDGPVVEPRSQGQARDGGSEDPELGHRATVPTRPIAMPA
jgi:hypothetical protein